MICSVSRKFLPALVVAFVVPCLSLHALIIDLGITTGSPSSPTDELSRLNTQIDAYNLAHPSSPLVDAITHQGQVKPPTTSPTSITIDLSGVSYNYIVLKWGNSDQFYYIGGETGPLTFNSTVFTTTGGKKKKKVPNGLSHYALFDGQSRSVPDAGSSMALLGLSLGGLSVLSRRVKAAVTR